MNKFALVISTLLVSNAVIGGGQTVTIQKKNITLAEAVRLVGEQCDAVRGMQLNHPERELSLEFNDTDCTEVSMVLRDVDAD